MFWILTIIVALLLILDGIMSFMDEQKKTGTMYVILCIAVVVAAILNPLAVKLISVLALTLNIVKASRKFLEGKKDEGAEYVFFVMLIFLAFMFLNY